MALNLDKIKQRLASFDNKGKKSANKNKDTIWKPQSGKQVIRIVPNQFQPDDPFTPLSFHYDFGGKTYLSPSSVKKPDPIVELAERLKKNPDTWQQGRKLEPKLRTYVPIIVRGEEEKGVRFWAFGVQIYKQLMSAIAEPDYGDITDLQIGYDITVEYKTKEEAKKDFPETSIQIKPKQRPAIDPTNPKAKELLELITTKQPNIQEIFEVPSYETLQTALEEFLNSGKAESESPSTANTATTSVPVAEVTAPKTVTDSPSAAKATENVADMSQAFDNLFNS